MTKTTSAVKAFISARDCEPLAYENLENAVEAICCSEQFRSLLLSLIDSPAFAKELGEEFAKAGAVKGLSACRKLRSCLNLSLSNFFGLLAELILAFDETIGAEWYAFANKIHSTELCKTKLLDRLLTSKDKEYRVKGKEYKLTSKRYKGG